MRELIDEIKVDSEIGIEFVKLHQSVKARMAACRVDRENISFSARLLGFFRRAMKFLAAK